MEKFGDNAEAKLKFEKMGGLEQVAKTFTEERLNTHTILFQPLKHQMAEQ